MTTSKEPRDPLTQTPDWVAPDWPVFKRLPLYAVDRIDTTTEGYPPALAPKVRKVLREIFRQEVADSAIRLTREALWDYHVDLQRDWSWKAGTRSTRDRTSAAFRLQRWIKPLREWRDTDTKFENGPPVTIQRFDPTEEEITLLRRVTLPEYQPIDPELDLDLNREIPAGFDLDSDLRELRRLTGRLIRAVDGACSQLDEDPGRHSDIEARLLVARLAIVWEKLTDDVIVEHGVFREEFGSWRFPDYVSSVLGSLQTKSRSNLTGARMINELLRARAGHFPAY